MALTISSRPQMEKRGTGRFLASGGAAHCRPQAVVNRLPSAVKTPSPKDAINRSPLGKIVGQHSPRTAAAVDIQDRFNHTAPVDGPRRSHLARLRQQRFNQLPLLIRKIAGIMVSFHGLGSFPSLLQVGRSLAFFSTFGQFTNALSVYFARGY